MLRSRGLQSFQTARRASAALSSAAVPGLPKVVGITGASGMLGTALCESLSKQDVEVVRFVRRAAKGPNEAFWDPINVEVDLEAVARVDAVVHLAGANIGAGPMGLPRWTEATKTEIMESRRNGTRAISRALAQVSSAASPKTLVSASGVGVYGSGLGSEPVTEESPVGSGFLAEVAEVWERETAEAAASEHVRVALARFGVILSPKGGAMERLVLPFRLGLGGRVGPGTQHMGWISLTDAVRAVEFLLAGQAAEPLEGAFNVVGKEPATNADLTAAMADAVGMPAVCPLPAPMVRLMFGEMGEETLLCSHNAQATRLQAAGFNWLHPTISDAVQYELQRR